MQTPQELLAISKQKGVPILETSKQLDWQQPTEKVWVRTAYNNEYSVMTLKELEYEKSLLDMTDGIGYSSVICAAPQMHEIAPLLPPFINASYQTVFQKTLKNELVYCENVEERIWVSVENHHYAQAYAELYIKLKSEKLQP